MSLLLGFSASALGYYFYSNKENIILNFIKGYTYIDETIKHITYNPNLEMLDEISVVNEYDDLLNKILVYKYKSKIYREIIDINENILIHLFFRIKK